MTRDEAIKQAKKRVLEDSEACWVLKDYGQTPGMYWTCGINVWQPYHERGGRFSQQEDCLVLEGGLILQKE